ncbi:MAG: hypothetical protein RLY97_1464 [Pseudomonadota bacterium]
MNFASRPAFAALLLSTVALSACATKPPAQLPPEPGPATSYTTPVSQLRGPALGSQAEFLATMAGRDVVYFDTDKYNIAGNDAAALQVQAQWLLRNPGKQATIEGHCDERGTRDYNLALGQRRAVAVRDYLVSLGVESARLSPVSYGKERPAAMGSNEESWARNRRAVTVTID